MLFNNGVVKPRKEDWDNWGYKAATGSCMCHESQFGVTQSAHY